MDLVKNFKSKRLMGLAWIALWLFTMQSPCFGPSAHQRIAAQEKYLALPLTNGVQNGLSRISLTRSRDMGRSLEELTDLGYMKLPRAPSVQINGKSALKPSIEHSGDSWWVRLTPSVGPITGSVKK